MPIYSSVSSRVPKSLYDAQTVVIAIVDDVPIVLAVPASTVVGRKASGDVTALNSAEIATILGLKTHITFVINGAGAAPTTGVKAAAAARVPFNCTVTRWSIYGDVSGSAVVDILKDTHANFPPTDADRIAGTDKPTLSAVQMNTSTALTGWTTTINAGDVLVPEIESASTLTQIIIALEVQRT